MGEWRHILFHLLLIFGCFIQFRWKTFISFHLIPCRISSTPLESNSNPWFACLTLFLNVIFNCLLRFPLSLFFIFFTSLVFLYIFSSSNVSYLYWLIHFILSSFNCKLFSLHSLIMETKIGQNSFVRFVFRHLSHYSVTLSFMVVKISTKYFVFVMRHFRTWFFFFSLFQFFVII